MSKHPKAEARRNAIPMPKGGKRDDRAAGVILDLQAPYRGAAGSINTPESVALKPAFLVSFTLTGPVTLHER